MGRGGLSKRYAKEVRLAKHCAAVDVRFRRCAGATSRRSRVNQM